MKNDIFSPKKLSFFKNDDSALPALSRLACQASLSARQDKLAPSSLWQEFQKYIGAVQVK